MQKLWYNFINEILKRHADSKMCHKTFPLVVHLLIHQTSLKYFHIFFIYSQAATKDFWCSRPEHLKTISVELWRNLTQPINQCTIVNAPFATLDAFNLTDFLTNTSSIELVKCTSWEFDMSLIGNTILSEWNLVCDKLYLSSVVESCFLAGAGLGSVTSGWISDQYGRKHTLMAFASVQLVTGELTNVIWIYLILFAICAIKSSF